MSFRIKEIFGPTIQGEGTHTGTACFFIRTTGCNRWSGLPEHKPNSICSFCDTDFYGGEKMTASEIARALDKKRRGISTIDTVVISGGEPTLQLNKELVKTLHLDGWNVHIETNGSREITDEMRYYIKHITCSPKQSLSETKLTRCNDLKLLFPFISEDITIDGFNYFSCDRKWLQPVMGPDYSANLHRTIQKLYRNPDWRLSLQTHKIIGVD